MSVDPVAHDPAEQLAANAERAAPPLNRPGSLALESRRIDRPLPGDDERGAGRTRVEPDQVEDELCAGDESCRRARRTPRRARRPRRRPRGRGTVRAPRARRAGTRARAPRRRSRLSAARRRARRRALRAAGCGRRRRRVPARPRARRRRPRACPRRRRRSPCRRRRRAARRALAPARRARARRHRASTRAAGRARSRRGVQPGGLRDIRRPRFHRAASARSPSTGRPNGSPTTAVCHSPPSASRSTAAVPSPPSATGSSSSIDTRDASHSGGERSTGLRGVRTPLRLAGDASAIIQGLLRRACPRWRRWRVVDVAQRRVREALASEEDQADTDADRSLDRLQADSERDAVRVLDAVVRRAGTRRRSARARSCPARAGRSSRRSSGRARGRPQRSAGGCRTPPSPPRPRTAGRSSRANWNAAAVAAATGERMIASPWRRTNEQRTDAADLVALAALPAREDHRVEEQRQPDRPRRSRSRSAPSAGSSRRGAPR